MSQREPIKITVEDTRTGEKWVHYMDGYDGSHTRGGQWVYEQGVPEPISYRPSPGTKLVLRAWRGLRHFDEAFDESDIVVGHEEAEAIRKSESEIVNALPKISGPSNPNDSKEPA